MLDLFHVPPHARLICNSSSITIFAGIFRAGICFGGHDHAVAGSTQARRSQNALAFRISDLQARQFPVRAIPRLWRKHRLRDFQPATFFGDFPNGSSPASASTHFAVEA